MQLLDNGSYSEQNDPGEPSTGKPRLSVTDDEGAFLSWVATGRRVCEIGTGLGVSTGYLAARALRVVTYDIDSWVRENVWPLLPSNVYPRNERKQPSVPYDVTFIDGDHRTEKVRDDIDFALTVTRGVIVMHDAKMLSVLDALNAYPFNWSMIETTHGIATTWVWNG